MSLAAAVDLATFVLGSFVGIALVHWLRLAHGRIATDLLDMSRLNQPAINLCVRVVRSVNVWMKSLVTAIALSQADKGNVQLLDSDSGALTIAAQRGFEEPFLSLFEYVRDDASRVRRSNAVG